MKLPNTERKVASIPPFGLRMQPELKQQIEDQAQTNGRSLNAEIIWRLEHSLTATQESPAWIKKAKKMAKRSSISEDRLSVLEQDLTEMSKSIKLLLQERQERTEQR